MRLNNTTVEFLGLREDDRGYIRYLYAIKEGDETVGDCELRLGDVSPELGNIGYAVDPEHRGRGHAKNACTMLIGEGKRLGLSEIFVCCREDNAASRHICKYLGGREEPVGEKNGKKIYKYIF